MSCARGGAGSGGGGEGGEFGYDGGGRADDPVRPCGLRGLCAELASTCSLGEPPRVLDLSAGIGPLGLDIGSDRAVTWNLPTHGSEVDVCLPLVVGWEIEVKLLDARGHLGDGPEATGDALGVEIVVCCGLAHGLSVVRFARYCQRTLSDFLQKQIIGTGRG